MSLRTLRFSCGENAKYILRARLELFKLVIEHIMHKGRFKNLCVHRRLTAAALLCTLLEQEWGVR